VRSIVELAETLRLIVAEGIETDEQRAELRRLHAEKGQGFLFARPLNVEAIDEFLDSGDAAHPSPAMSAAEG